MEALFWFVMGALVFWAFQRSTWDIYGQPPAKRHSVSYSHNTKNKDGRHEF